MLFSFWLQKLVVIGIVVVTVFHCIGITRNLEGLFFILEGTKIKMLTKME
jgi:hypothetical protein